MSMGRHPKRAETPRASLACVVLLAASLPASQACAGTGSVILRMPPPVTPGLASVPRIASPVVVAEARINAALERLDETVHQARAECRNTLGHPTSWNRDVEVPMRGPSFLSVVVHDETDCGGAHPDASTMAIIYDLRSGRPVDWATLLPALSGTLSLTTGEDGTRTVRLASVRLRALFLAHYDRGKAGDTEDCKDEIRRVATDEPFGLSAWLDAKQGGLVLQTDLPHAIQLCAIPVLIPTATLRQQGAGREVTDALVAAVKTRAERSLGRR